MPTFGSLFSGVGGMDLGLEWAGWECKWQVEIDDWRRQVLTRHWPEVPKWKDICDFPALDPIYGLQRSKSRPRREGRYGLGSDRSVDLICAGVPCQDVSVAGRRAGLAGERTGLFFEFARILRELQPKWFLFENVPGLLSSNQGLDFAIVLDTLDELGYGVAWRILNSQFFGVPQRRRRVFIVGHLGGPCPPEILFESEGGGGNPQTGGETGQGVANPLGASTSSFGGQRYDLDNETYVADTLSIGANQTFGFAGEAVACIKGAAIGREPENGPQRGEILTDGTCYTLNRVEQHAIAFESRIRGDDGRGYEREPRIRADGIAWTLQAVDCGNVCAPADPHRMLQTPGPAGWLDACSRCPDGRRYAALGDAVTAVVAGWIGRRILKAME